MDELLNDAGHKAEIAGDYRQAAQNYGRLLDNNPDDTAVAVSLSRALRLGGRPSDALQVVEASLARLGSVAALDQLQPILVEQGKTQIALGRAELALPPLQRATTINPGDPDAPATLGIALDRLGRFDEAAISYRQAVSLAPDNPDILNNMGLSRALAGHLAEGLALLRQAASLPSAGPQVRENLVLLLNLNAAPQLPLAGPIPLSAPMAASRRVESTPIPLTTPSPGAVHSPRKPSRR